MKITGKTLQVSIEHNVTVGKEAIEATLHHMAWISEDPKGEIHIDLDFCDITNVKFMGMPIEDGYKGYEKFKKSMSELGVNITKMFDEKASKLITDIDMFELKRMYKR